jgi:hypothetical protein
MRVVEIGSRGQDITESRVSLLIPVAVFLLLASSLTNNVLPRALIRSQGGKQASQRALCHYHTPLSLCVSVV